LLSVISQLLRKKCFIVSRF